MSAIWYPFDKFLSDAIRPEQRQSMDAEMKSRNLLGLAKSFIRLPVVAPALVIAVTVALLASGDVHAAQGQCKWEGGQGVDGGYPYCAQEDCIGNGGLAVCSDAQAVAGGSHTNEQLGAERWAYQMCHESGWYPSYGGRWCGAAGGDWQGNYVGCLSTPPDILNLVGNMTSDESRSKSISNSFVNSSCGEPADTGWGATYTSYNCFGGSTVEEYGIETQELRRLTYGNGENCSGTETVSLRRYREAECPLTYESRNAVNGPECVKPQPVECDDPCLMKGNPVSVATGTKFEREVDYQAAANTGLEFTRYYRSNGYYRPPGASFSPASGSISSADVWRHTYDRQFYGLSSSVYSGVMAVVQRPNGSLRVFDLNGDETTNHKGTGATLEAVSGGGWDLTLDDGEVEHYDSSGRLITITTRAGNVTTLSYTDGLLTTVTGPFGHTLALTYNDKDLLATVTYPDSGVVQYAYDALQRLTSVTYPDSTSREYQYESSVHEFLLTGIVDENDELFATFQYDSEGRVISESHAGGVHSYSFSYDAANGLTSLTDPLGTTTDFAYTAVGGMLYLSGPAQPCMDCGRWASTTHDANGNPATRTGFNGEQTVYTYDQTRNLELSRTEAYGTPRARTVTTEWHPTYRVPTKIAEPGRETTYTHDSNGNVLTATVTDTVTSESRTWIYSYNGQGQVVTIDGPRAGVSDITTLTYSSCTTGTGCGQVATITDPAGNVTSVLSYDANGLPLTVSDVNGTVTTLTYDARQRLTSSTIAGETTSIDYWPTGLVKQVTQPDGSFVAYDYDDAHRLVEISDATGNRIAYTLDGAGNRLSETVYDPFDTVTYSRTYQYDALGRLIEEQGAQGQTTSYTYDAAGNLTSQMDPLGRETVYGYDELDRLTAITDPLLQLTEFGYDALDRLLTITDPKSLTTSYGYDGLGDQGQLTSPDTGVTTYTHDAAGNVDAATDARGNTADYSYDAAGRLTEIDVPDRTLQYSYDQGPYGAGRLTEVADSQSTVTWSYDAPGRVTQRTQTVDTVTLTVAYGFDAYGRPSTLTTPSGQVIGYSYGNGRVTGLTVNGGTLLGQMTYRPFGPISGWQWGNGSTAARTYDTDGRLTGISSAGTTGYAYFLDSQIKSITADVQYTPVLTAGSTLYTVDTASNRMQSASGLDARSYSYDAAGNTLSDGTRTYTYNDSGRLATATHNGVTTSYVYNGLGERVKKSSAGVTRYFAYDEAGHLLGEYDAQGDLIQETVWLGDSPVATLRPDGSGGIDIFYVHTDHLNTPRRVTRPVDNVVVWRWQSAPFGATDAEQDPDGDQIMFAYNLRFPGQYWDEETELHYNYFRTYDPTTGRYLESDPIGLAGGINTYGYARNDPLGLYDSLGLVPFDELFLCLMGSEGVSVKGCFQDLASKALGEHRDAAELVAQELKDGAVKCGMCVARCSVQTLIGASPEEFLLTFGEEVAERYTLNMVELAAGKSGRMAVKTAIKRVTAPIDAGRLFVCTLDCD